MSARRGFSLIELLVVVVVLGVISATASLAFRPPASSPSGNAVLLAARHQAIRTGMPVAGHHDSTGSFSAHPHGMIVTDSAPYVRFTVEAYAK